MPAIFERMNTEGRCRDTAKSGGEDNDGDLEPRSLEAVGLSNLAIPVYREYFGSRPVKNRC